MNNHLRTLTLVLVSTTMLSLPAVGRAQYADPYPSAPENSAPSESPWQAPQIQMPSIVQGPHGYSITFPGYPTIEIPSLNGLLQNLQSNQWQVPQQMPAPAAPNMSPKPPPPNGWTYPQASPTPTQPSTNGWNVPPTQPNTNGWNIPPTQPNTNGWNIPPTQPNTNGWNVPPTPTPAPAPNSAAIQPSASGQVVGVFAGITNYNGSGNLPNCADDAILLAQAFVNAGIIRQSDAIVLTDQQATRQNISNAIRQLSARVPADGMLVFFFSGHGDNTSDNNGDEVDGMDETIVLSDGSMTDDELVALLQGGSRDMVALDTCYAGGFQQDVSSIPQSVGFYSSGENETSSVASEFGAGGYLSHFLRTGVEASRGQQLQVGQLQQHIQQGYMTSGANGQQQLVVGMGQGNSQSTVLFDSRPQPTSVATR